eukprot:CAMPEP_0206455698 /NCGR_PEP_ID=MMETSP0324_2-20121206/21924_1 /ASSEMBLY_ACC=CAM_ASM_000836 /TAXON_ID=2866 /ORGANISM="Crypthecodinium cohnii, Strain Seligo" /LENGTH=65 /DNA_ID=CAMNT_0053926485 /DNA_START=107 /DNA_END=304 /DNA_ORIENTATION=+
MQHLQSAGPTEAIEEAADLTAFCFSFSSADAVVLDVVVVVGVVAAIVAAEDAVAELHISTSAVEA